MGREGRQQAMPHRPPWRRQFQRASIAGLRNIDCGNRPGAIVLMFQQIALRTLHVNVCSGRDRGADKDKCRRAGFIVASGPSFESTVKIVTFGAMH